MTNLPIDENIDINLLKEEVEFLRKENARLFELYKESQYEIVALMPQQSGVKCAYGAFNKRDKRVLFARAIGVLVGLAILAVGTLMTESTDSDADNNPALNFLAVLALLLGWKAHQIIKYALLKKPTPHKENLIFNAWLMAATIIYSCMYVSNEIIVKFESSWEQVLSLLLLPVSIVALLLIGAWYKRRADALESSRNDQ